MGGAGGAPHGYTTGRLMDGSSEHDARLEVRGGRRLEGEVVLSGAKNSALKLLAASLLTTDPCVIRRVPRITDVATMVTMLRALGADVERRGRRAARCRPEPRLTGCAPYELVRTMRASIIVMGPLVARLGEATIAMPGGCNIGPRRIDFHIRGLEKLGAHIDIDHGFIRVHSDGLKGAVVPLDYPSVGATENLVMAATAAEGETVIENAAREPEIMDLCEFLCGMGADDRGRRHQHHPHRRRAAAARRRPRRHRRPHRGGHLPAHGRRHRRPGDDRRSRPGPSRALPRQAAGDGRAVEEGEARITVEP